MATEDRRRDLRDRLIRIAEAKIAASGLASLRARDLAAEAGCAVGAIYNAVGDLAELVLHVNARTFEALGNAVLATLATAPTEPAARLVVMAQGYHHFAAANHNLWRALFDIDRPEGEEPPDWYRARLDGLFSLIEEALGPLTPDLSDEDRVLLARALFSSVHGIVLLALDRAQAGVPAPEADRMIALVLSRLVAPTIP